jgi:hypothetical protein
VNLKHTKRPTFATESFQPSVKGKRMAFRMVVMAEVPCKNGGRQSYGEIIFSYSFFGALSRLMETVF